MKKILGLDIGVSSVGLAIIFEENGVSEIKKLAVRIVPEDVDFHGNFYSGNTSSKNLGRRIKRSIRRGYQRRKLRKDALYKLLMEIDFYPNESLRDLNTIELYGLRAKAISERISIKELGRIFMHINQKRGFLSNKKSNSKEDDSSEFKNKINSFENKLENNTIGQGKYDELLDSSEPYGVKLRNRTYLRKTHILEFNKIWEKQRSFYPEILSGSIYDSNLKGTLLKKIRDNIIFFQRPLKSQKSLISNCLFEKNLKVAPKSSPFFEMFRIYQTLNDLKWKDITNNNFEPSQEQRSILFQKLFFADDLNKNVELTETKIKELLGFKKNEKLYFNFPRITGSKTVAKIKEALAKAGIENHSEYLDFNYENTNSGNLFDLWHITYSIYNQEDLIKTLNKRFGFSPEQASFFYDISYPSEYSSLSTKALRKLLKYMTVGFKYSEACDEVEYDHSGYKTNIELSERLEPLKPNELRNPVVEQILNQMVNCVNLAMDKYGKFDEIRVELARELKNNAKRRKLMSESMEKNRKLNINIKEQLADVFDQRFISLGDIKRYKFWNETNQICLYCNKSISQSDFLNGFAEIEHIIPKSRCFNNSNENMTLAHRKCNQEKGQLTANDYMLSKGEIVYQTYLETVNDLRQNSKISKNKWEFLLTTGKDIPTDFVSRMLKDTQFITKEAVKRLKTVCHNVLTTTGQITDFLRDEWGLNRLLEELALPKFREVGQTEIKEIKDRDQTKKIEKITNWTKRDDHRHHAIDALITALTSLKIIYKLNNLNKNFQYEKGLLTPDEIKEFELSIEKTFNLKEFSDQIGVAIPIPIKNLRNECKTHLERIFISFKKSNSKVLSKSINRIKSLKGTNPKQVTVNPRGMLHEETIHRCSSHYEKVELNHNFNQISQIVNEDLKTILNEHLEKYNGDFKKALSKKELEENPIFFNHCCPVNILKNRGDNY